MATIEQLKTMADKLRIHSLKMTTAAGSGHPTTCLSAAEIMSVLFFSVIKEGDEFILSKGHAAPILWDTFAEAGLIERDELKNLRKIDSVLEGHPTRRMPLIKVASGSLGQGLSAGVGMALASRRCRHLDHVHIRHGDFLHLREPGAYDLIIAAEILYFLWQPPRLRLAVREKLAELLAEDGILILVWGGYRLQQDWDAFLPEGGKLQLLETRLYDDPERPYRISLLGRAAEGIAGDRSDD